MSRKANALKGVKKIWETPEVTVEEIAVSTKNGAVPMSGFEAFPVYNAS